MNDRSRQNVVGSGCEDTVAWGGDDMSTKTESVRSVDITRAQIVVEGSASRKKTERYLAMLPGPGKVGITRQEANDRVYHAAGKSGNAPNGYLPDFMTICNCLYANGLIEKSENKPYRFSLKMSLKETLDKLRAFSPAEFVLPGEGDSFVPGTQYDHSKLMHASDFIGDKRLATRQSIAPAQRKVPTTAMAKNGDDTARDEKPSDVETMDVLDDLETHRAETDSLPPTEREEVRESRIGQGKFRQKLLEHWGVCAVTGLSEQSLLRASHIKPWRDSDNRERLDLFNGLLLAPNFDALFDTGLISFDDSGRILLSANLSREDRRLLGVNDNLRLKSVDERHKKYLCFHREIHGFNQ